MSQNVYDDRAVGEAIAETLLLEPRFYRFDSRLPEALTEDWFFILLTDHCDAFLGMPMGLADDTYMRKLLDEAIAALSEDGYIDALLDEYRAKI